MPGETIVMHADAPRPRVGIPRAMGYYYLYPFFRTLLLAWGAEPVLSPPTTQRLLDRMDLCPTDEPCLAVKLHFSHAETLTRRDVDFLFLPIIARVEKTCCCPKFIGIGDMIRHGLSLTDAQVVMPVLDYTDDEAEMARTLQPLAARLRISDRRRIRDGIRDARAAQEAFRALCIAQRLTTPEAYQVIEAQALPPCVLGDGPPVAVIGHPYLLYETVSQGMIERLRAYGPVYTAEMVAQEAITREVATFKDGPQLWPFEAMLLGAALHLLRTRAVEKIILVGSFECGPESIIETFVEEEAHRQQIPFMLLALDEHSGEAGLATRLEAFMDMEPVPEPAESLPTPHVAPAAARIVGMPSMGHLDLAIRAMLESLGVRTLPTPAITPAVIELGREVAPEFVCFPFTATLGQMRRTLDQGATALLMVGGKGYCRLGWYAQVQEKLLRDLGYSFEMLVVDSPFPLRDKGRPFAAMLRALVGDVPWSRIIGALFEAYARLEATDQLERLLHRLRAYERVRGTADSLYVQFMRRVATADGVGAIRRLARECRAAFAAIEIEDTDPLRVRLAGEIWVVLEAGATREVERWLGARPAPRVWVDREFSASHWFGTHVWNAPGAMRREEAILAAARPWLAHKVGGHGQLTVGLTALARQEGMDGLLHVFPFTCMPEIIAQNIMVRLGETLDLPILTYIVSEQTGEAGMETRLESFLDLLEERRTTAALPCGSGELSTL